MKNMLFLIKIYDSASLQEKLLNIKDIWEQLTTIGRMMGEEYLVVITMKILLCAYDHFIETLNIISMDFDMNFDELCNKILQQDRWKT